MKQRHERLYSYPTRTAKLIILVCILSLAAPLAILVALSENLSRPLALNGCLPDGGFAIYKSQFGQEQGSYRSWKARLVMLIMALLTIYIATFPTLFSAMTGYYSPGRLMIRYHPSTEDMGEVDEVDCRGIQMMPAWGVLLDGERVRLDSPTAFSYVYPDVHSMREYYSIYESAYNAAECTNAESTADCPATNISSQYISPRNVTYCLDPPLLNFHLLSNDSLSMDSPSPSPDKMPVAWVCDFALFYHTDFFAHSGIKEPNATGSCQSASDGYIWGFSYILLFIVCLLNLITGLALYGLWIYGHGSKEGTLRGREPASQLRAAANIIQQAREYYGDEAVNGDWDCRKMERDIFGGDRGMRIIVCRDNRNMYGV
ncbi:hypothetical protein P170DRAFT_477446 [Aspergillus steynii IBT 23096]|uniref:Uncharacterized protein n=1 Tax=Aspergillus steynii IBT 23096 TaxID=1392250 RepID=A0A2I2G150_9EURO|nr:uncharacterized protein P170DRAFT_477446 [Aspergillus steynii IBT 23096]PLB46566.1 hypothetical protein P170DRAFT_477446 [Aspergillus steynii IBT 23096]